MMTQARGRTATAWSLLIGLGLTAVLSTVLYRAELRRVEERFDQTAERAADSLAGEVERGVAVAEAARGFVLASNEVTAEAFMQFVEQLQLSDRFPSANGVNLVRVVDANDTARFEEETQALGQDDFTVSPPEPVGETRYVIQFMEPRETNVAAIGFDISANPLALVAANAAIEQDEPTMTAPFTLVQERGDQAGFVVYDPLRSGGSSAVAGFTSIVFRGGDLVAQTFEDRDDIVVTVTDADGGGGPDDDGFIGTSADREAGAAAERTLVVERQVFGRNWQVRVDAVKGDEVPLVAPLLTAVLGILLTFSVITILQSLRRQEQRAIRIAEEATADLQGSQDKLASANVELEASNTGLEQSNLDLSRFAHVASHDLKEPLRMVSGFAGILESSLRKRLDDGLSEGEETALGYIRRGTARMQELISDLLELASVREVRRRERVDVAAEVARVLEVMQPEIDDTDADIVLGQLDDVVADPRQMPGLITNLLTNALKFRRKDLRPMIELSAVLVDGTWRLDVADNGIGIDPTDRAKVFDAFKRLHSREAYEGSGVGLAICQAVVQSYGGSIEIVDGIDAGTRVIATIPQ